MTIATAVSKRIDEFLYLRDISLYKLARDSGLSPSTLQNLYRGNTKSPSLAMIYKICNGLKITIFEFLDSPFFSQSEIELD